MLKAQISGGERMINTLHLVASVAAVFRSGRDFLAWIGFVPEQRCSEDPADRTAPDRNDWGAARHGLHESEGPGRSTGKATRRKSRHVPTAPAHW
jgi:hypothetical protein